MLLKTKNKGLEYNIDMTMKYVTLDALLEGASNVTSFLKGVTLSDSTSSYITSSMFVGLLEYIPFIKKEFEARPNTKMNIIKKISYTLGSITSLIISYGYDGVNFYLSLGLNLVKNIGTTFLITKLNKLHQIDGLSVAIIIGFICSIPSMCKSIMNKDLIQIILSIISILALLGINYKIITSNKEIDIDYLNHKDKLKINFSSIYSLSVMLTNALLSILLKIGITGLLMNQIMILVIPIIGFILSNDIHDLSKNIDKYLSSNNGCIDGMRPGEERKKYLLNIVRKNNFKIGVLGGFVLLITFNILLILGITSNISLYITLILNSIVQINYSIKSIKAVNRVKNIKLIQ